MSIMRIKGLGGMDEIGASSAQIEFLGNINRNALLDSGIRMINKRGPRGGFRGRSEGHIPPDVRIDAALITHGHSDHHGNLPHIWPEIVEANHDAKVYMTKPTFYTAGNLWVNYSYLMAHNKVAVSLDREANFNRGMRMIVEQARNTWVEKPGWAEIFPGIDAYFHPNGHIRGSAMIVLRIDLGNGKYFYIAFSGDWSIYDSPTVKGMKIAEEFIGKIDVMFVESTYGDSVLVPRAEQEDLMAHLANKTIERGGIALGPAFGVGRCPDATIAQYLRNVCPLYADGMGKQFLELCADPDKGYWCELDHMSGVDLASSGVRFVEGRPHREELIYESGGLSVVCTAGMMIEDSCAWQYATENRFLESPLNTVLQTGYQAENTEGWELQQAVKNGQPFFIDDRAIEVRAEVPEQLQLSSHADGMQSAYVVNIYQPKKVFIGHGNDNGREGLKQNLLKLGFRGEIHLPRNGDILEF